MSLEGKSRKRKSGAAYHKEKKAKIDEERKLGSFMLNVLQTTETDMPAVLDLTCDICIDPPAVALDLTSDNSLVWRIASLIFKKAKYCSMVFKGTLLKNLSGTFQMCIKPDSGRHIVWVKTEIGCSRIAVIYSDKAVFSNSFPISWGICSHWAT